MLVAVSFIPPTHYRFIHRAGCISISDGIVHFLLPGFKAHDTVLRNLWHHLGQPCNDGIQCIFITTAPFWSTVGANYSGACGASGGGASGGGVVCPERSRLGTAPTASSAPSASGCKGSSLDSALVGELSTLGDGLPAAVPAAAATCSPAIDRVELPLLKLQSTTPLAAA